jgi:biotin carboxyl carrier protein
MRESAESTAASGPSRVSADQCVEVLARQCRTAPAEAAALIRFDEGGRVEILASVPALRGEGESPPWLRRAAARAAAMGADARARVVEAKDVEEQAVAVVPIAGARGTVHLCALYLLPSFVDDRALVLDRLVASAAGLHMLDAQSQLSRQAGEIDRLHRALSALTGLASHDRFTAASMALCNRLAAEWSCDRVSLGVAKGKYVRIAAMSHTEHVTAKSSLAQDVEAAMEECFDQDQEIRLPSDAGETAITRAAREFRSRHGPGSMVSVPLRRGGAPFAVLTLERPAEAPFTLAEVATLRLVAEASAGQVWLAHRYRRGALALLAEAARSAVAGMLGPRHAGAKLLAIGLLASAVFFVLVPGTYRVRGDARVEADQRRVVAAPFDGFLGESAVRVGDTVEAGAMLARLDTVDLVLRRASLHAEHDGAVREAALAQRERKDAESQIARARAKKLAADMEHVERLLEQAEVKSPASGVIIAGDLERAIGAPVNAGDVLFEVAPLDALCIEVFVAEDQIGDVREGASGRFAPASRPDVRLAVEASRIDPMAVLREGRNVFRVRASLGEQPDWLRPGMEGVVRFDAGSRAYPWIWTRRFVNWVRMRLWV